MTSTPIRHARTSDDKCPHPGASRLQSTNPRKLDARFLQLTTKLVHLPTMKLQLGPQPLLENKWPETQQFIKHIKK